MMKKQVKKVILQIVTVLVMLTLAGCSNGVENLETSSPDNSANTGGIVQTFQTKVATISSFFQAQSLPLKILLIAVTTILLLPTPIFPVNLSLLTAVFIFLV